jgi:hypothetical protein
LYDMFISDNHFLIVLKATRTKLIKEYLRFT